MSPEPKARAAQTTYDINIMKSVLSERQESPNLQKPRGRLACGANWFVWGVWGAMLLAALAFVWKFGSNVPYWDEWGEMVPILTGEQPVNAAWLWSEHNGHRIPLPKLLLLAACKLTGSDFRVGMYAQCLSPRGSGVHHDPGCQGPARRVELRGRVLPSGAASLGAL